ncbi:MAG: LD-carboxypeptidase [Pseudomonadota bacterium]
MRIGIVAPAGAIDETVATRTQALAALMYPQVELVFHPQCYLRDGHFAGPDAARAAAFLDYANDPAFDAIWFARGGYGSNRILDIVMPELKVPAHNKTYLGFSDMGFMLGALYARRIGRPVHGSMPSSLTSNDIGHSVGRALAWLAEKNRDALEPGLDGRPAAAFNLAILTAMIGTPWLPDLADHVLLIEEVSEPLYRIDRMLFQVANATQLKGIAGIRLGHVTDIKSNNPEFAEDPEQMIVRWCKAMGVPYLGRAIIGHIEENRVVPFGMV